VDAPKTLMMTLTMMTMMMMMMMMMMMIPKCSVYLLICEGSSFAVKGFPDILLLLFIFSFGLFQCKVTDGREAKTCKF
jgi:hypothetical protein